MSRSSAPAQSCALPTCARRTTSPTGLCHDHRSAPFIAAARLLPNPALARLPVVVTSGDGVWIESWRDEKGDLHRTDGAAYRFFSGGRLEREEWFLHGKPKRADGGASVISYRADGSVEAESFYVGRVLVREDGPARIFYGTRGLSRIEEWFTGGRRGRVDGPAEISYDETGEVIEERWHSKGARHRIDGPAVTIREGGAIEERWYFEDAEVEGHADIADRLRKRENRVVLETISASPLAPLLTDVPAPVIVDAIGEGIRTCEGVREFAAGAPPEWVRAFETSPR